MIQDKINSNYVRIINFVTDGLDSGSATKREKCRLFIKMLNDPIYTLDRQRLFCATWFRRNLNKWITEEDVMRFFEGVIF